MTEANRLIHEKSPYLLQHAHNPVDWFPWGPEAFTKARTENKPIFLSVGYSTCHWCHVMERESFENAEIAELLNQNFVSIKVDREERPDVDRVYMMYVQATTGHGGWPMSVFLTPELQPFFGGTYFPPRSHQGSVSFPDLLNGLSRAWDTEREAIVANARQLVDRLRQITAATASADLNPRMDAEAFKRFQSMFDGVYGGFGGGMKFPRPVTFHFLLRYAHRHGERDALVMVEKTLREMAKGGMMDHLGGGFHRYSVDRYWHVPHFEKMLYDQAQLLTSYIEAHDALGHVEFADVARDIIRYVDECLTDSSTGAFYSAEDADSPLPEDPKVRREGAFYVWTEQELKSILGADAEWFGRFYGVKPDGNAHDPHGELVGKNVLHQRQSVAELAQELQVSPGETIERLQRARQTLHEKRKQRPRPHLDDKILSAWNGLMIGALARAGRALGDPAIIDLATRAAEFIEAKLYRSSDGQLLRRYRAGDAGCPANVEDYAFLADGCFELYQSTLQLRWLIRAEELIEQAIARFYDAQQGGFFSSPADDETIILRLKDEHDGAEPSANSILIALLLRLGHSLDRPHWIRCAEDTLRFFSDRLQTAPEALPYMVASARLGQQPPPQVVLVGPRDGAAMNELVRAINNTFVPDLVVLYLDDAFRERYAKDLPHLQQTHAVANRATAYLCRERRCDPPTTSAEELQRQLQRGN